ncbi:MAG: hypothetical protein Q4G00_04930 [Clostridia bacterium]|nr:hypothetical protein [Clostridia bacterium]
MDVLSILTNNGKDLLPEELDLLRAELDTGDYDAGYIASCKALIREIENWRHETRTGEHTQKPVPEQMMVPHDKLVPSSAGGIPVPPPVPPEKMVASDLQRMRTEKDYKSAFKKYVKESGIVNEDFVVAHFVLFKDWELSAMLACIPFGEEFLEKYFNILDHKAIALHQLFSESFFMKHYAELDAETVLARGVNPWRDKALRSKQLDVFLRIKGVKL